jgi:hypothetical protein
MDTNRARSLGEPKNLLLKDYTLPAFQDRHELGEFIDYDHDRFHGGVGVLTPKFSKIRASGRLQQLGTPGKFHVYQALQRLKRVLGFGDYRPAKNMG